MTTIAQAVVARAVAIAEEQDVPADLARDALWAEVRWLCRIGRPITQAEIDAAPADLKSRAVAAGGTLWEKKGMSRVYLNRAEIDRLVTDLTWQEKDFLHNVKVWAENDGLHVKRPRGGSVGSGSGDEASALAKLQTALEAHHGADDEAMQAAKDAAADAPTTRERRMARAAKLEGWAAGNASRSDALAIQADRKADAIPFGQPILTDHYSAGRDMRYRESIQRDMRHAVEAENKAEDQARRAESIRSATEGSIFDDDPDAIERLEAKLAALVSRRSAIAAYNASARKALKADPESKHGNLELLDPSERRSVTDAYRFGGIRPGGVLPPYHAQNLGGNISRTAARIQRLKRAQQRTNRSA